MRENKMVDTEE